MTSTTTLRAATVTNPFATRFTRPGMVAPLDDAGRPLDMPALYDRAVARGGATALEGPHGTGKTTRLIALLTVAAARGRATAFVRASSPADAWRVARSLVALRRGTVVGLDGGERLPPGAFIILRLLARFRGVVVVATTHGPAGLPVIARCRSTPAQLAAIVDRLPPHEGRIDADDVSDAFARHGGDLREALFDLYDRFERRGG